MSVLSIGRAAISILPLREKSGLSAEQETAGTYAQAITILVRLLGYADSDAGMLWPTGYINLAQETGLSNGVSLSSGSSITRAQAVLLFCNLLEAAKKDGTYFVASLGTVTKSVILLDNAALSTDGYTAILTSSGTYKTSAVFSDNMLGLRGTLVTDSAGKAILFIPDRNSGTKITALSAESTWVQDKNSKKYFIASGTPAYTADGTTTWSNLWLSVKSGNVLTLQFTAAGSVEAVYLHTSSSSSVMVAKNEVKGNPFSAIITGTDYTIYKNGAEATVSDIRRYDVAEYNKAANALRVNDVRLTGYYENAYPNASYPESITVMGHKFEVLPSAAEDLSAFNIGSAVTLLLTEGGRVAGVVSPAAARGNAVGIVKSWSESSASVELLDVIDASTGKALTLSGVPSSKINLLGELVSVVNDQKGYIGLSKLSGNSVTGAISTTGYTLGTVSISRAVKTYDRVGKSALLKVDFKALAQSQISASQILYTHTDYAGKIDIIVLNDVTGDCYSYGFVKSDVEQDSSEFGTTYNKVISVTNSTGTAGPVLGGNSMSDGDIGGIAVSIDGRTLAGSATLTKVTGVSRTAFFERDGKTYVTLSNAVFEVSDKAQYWNNAADVWFNSLSEARAFAAALTVYYDRAPELGGKVRFVSAG